MIYGYLSCCLLYVAGILFKKKKNNDERKNIKNRKILTFCNTGRINHNFFQTIDMFGSKKTQQLQLLSSVGCKTNNRS